MTSSVTPKKPTLDSHEIARTAAKLSLEKQGHNPLIMDLREFGYLCDYYVVVNGDSDPQIKAIVERIEEGLKELGEAPWHVEGMDGRQWVLMDYVDVVVHVFRAETRDLYMLERLWGDAPCESIGD